ncbi:hypothetical protein [Isobaculum melis]|uniref:Uncharacterized protein n=1 Tax=Isobaculum melis TaxID=142588 RepID=A0A1H9UJ56_9LACT|nr:hypothetical protein [Isobaculum melis]SES09392.1 hypothetical protein SAMN04488559_1333 [Isobaculum melis]
MNYDDRMRKLADIKVRLAGKQALITNIKETIDRQAEYFDNWENLDVKEGHHYLKFRLKTEMGSYETLIENLIDNIHNQVISIQNQKDNEIAQLNYLATTYFDVEDYKKAKILIHSLSCDESVKTEIVTRFNNNNFIWKMAVG